LLALAALLVLLVIGGSGASALPQGFQETTLPFTTLVNPTDLTFQSSPSGLQLVVGSFTGATPFTRTLIEGSNNTVSASVAADVRRH
jgi:hypothetical protein